MEYEIKARGLTGRIEANEFEGVFIINTNLKKKLDRSGKKIKTTYLGIKANKNGEITSFYGDGHTYDNNDILSTREINIEHFKNSPEYSGLRKGIQKLLSYISQYNTLPKNNSDISKAF